MLSIKTKNVVMVLIAGLVLTASFAWANENPFDEVNATGGGMNLETTLYVGGSGPNNYTHIQDAIDDASDEDTVFVYDDLSPYYENVVIDNSISLVGEDRDTTIIDGGGSVVIHVLADLVNISGFTTRNGGYKGLDICSNYNKINGNNIVSNNAFGLFLYNSSKNDIWGNNVLNTNVSGGIYLRDSNSNNIWSNNIHNNSYGICLVDSNSNSIWSNNVSNSSSAGMKIFSSSNNTITGNNISNNSYGIRLSDSSNNNTIKGNTINSSMWRDITLMHSSNNTIYLNNFINNTNKVNSYNSSNIWKSTEKVSYTYNGTEFESYLGNYWDDYTGNDADTNGIGNTPYSINGDNDEYPLMEPQENYFIEENHPPIVNMTSPINGTEVNGTITITGDASDQDGNETLKKVEIRIDDGEWQNANGTTTWNYTWDTASVKNGNHTIYARAWDGTDYSSTDSIEIEVKNKKEEEGGGIPGFEFAFLIIAIAIIILFKRRKKKNR